MKRILMPLFLTACTALTLSQEAAQTKRGQADTPRPETLSAVRPGMPEESVLSGLNQRYNLTKIPRGTDKEESESWFVTGKTEREGGSVSFSNGNVKSVMEVLTETDSADTISFAKDLFAYLKPEVPQIASDAVSSNRRAAVVVELEEKHFRKGGNTVDFVNMRFRFKDAIYDVTASDSSFGPRPGPDLKISRFRGTE